MADEPIQISVTDTGTDAVAAKLEELGLTGEQAAATIQAGFAKLSEGATVVAARFAMMQSAAASGLGQAEVDALAGAINRLSGAQIQAAGSAAGLGTATTAAATSLGSMGSAATGAATGLTATGTAATGAAAAITRSGAAAANAAVSFGAFGKGFGLIAGLLSFTVFEKGSDAITRIDNQIKQVTTTTDQFNTAFKSLNATADQSQASFEATTKLYFNLANATKDLGIEQGKLLTFVDTVAKSLYAQGASNTQVTRTIYELSEAMAKGGLAGRQFNSVMMNAPGLLGAIADGLGVTREQLSKMAAGTGVASSKMDDATTSAEKQSIALEELDQNAKRHTIEMMNEQQHLTDLRNQLSRNSAAYRDLDTHSSNYYAKAAKDRQENLKINEEINAANIRLSVIATEQDISDKRKQILASKEATTQRKLDAQTLVDAGNKANAAVTALAARMEGTISGSFTVLNNSWDVYIGKVNDAVHANELVRGTIITIADTLDTTIPLIASFVAAWAISKIVTQVVALATALTPLQIGLIAVMIPLSILINRWDDFKRGLSAIGEVAKPLWQNFTENLNSIIKLATSVGTTFSDVWDKIKDGAQKVLDFFSNMFDQVSRWLGGLIDAVERLLGLQSKVSQSSSGGSQIGHARDGADFVVGGAGQATDSQLVQFMASPGERVIIQTQGQAANDNLPHMRDGGSLAVTGGLSGVNVAFIPSANSSVTGYTPAQEQAVQALAAPGNGGGGGGRGGNGGGGGSGGGGIGGTPDVLDQILSSMSIFSTSPVTFGRGVDAIAYYRNDPANTQFMPGWVQSILAKGISVIMYYRQLSRSAIMDGPYGVHDDSAIQQSYDTNRQAMILNNNTWGGGAGGSIHPDYQMQALMPAALRKLVSEGAIPWELDPANPNIIPPNSKPTFLVGQVSGAAGLGAIDTSDDPNAVAANSAYRQAQSEQAARDAAILDQEQRDYNARYAAAHATTPSGAIDPLYNYGNWRGANVASGSSAPISSTPNSNITGYSGGASPGGIESSGSVGGSGPMSTNGPMVGMRDGGDFTIPGAGAVDSRMIQFLGSPGEEVSVRRPQDQRNDRDWQRNTVVVNMNITASDVDSFRRSKQQLDMSLQRRLTKIARRV